MENRLMPVVPLRSISVLPGMILNFDVVRPGGVAAIEAAMKGDRIALLVTQKNPTVDKPEAGDLYRIGTVTLIKQVIKMPGNSVRVIAEGKQRGELISLDVSEECYYGTVDVKEEQEEQIPESKALAMHRLLHEKLEAYVAANPMLNKDLARQLLADKPLGMLLAQTVVQVPMTTGQHQILLEADTLDERFDALISILSSETEVSQIKKSINDKVKTKVDKSQRDYILREQIKSIREELGETDTNPDADEYSKKAEELDAPQEVKERIAKEIARFKSIYGSSAEAAVARGYIETLLALPWNKADEEICDLKKAEEILNRDHYGLNKVKDRILEFLAVRALTDKGDSPIICLVGPPGTGKTSIAKSVAEALEKKYVRICLGGVRDEAEIRGHRRTYVGALPGRIIAGLKDAGVKNPLMLLDEIDKMSRDYKGDTGSAMLEVLDAEQNSHFVDHYVEIPVDLSEVMFICTANTTETIPRPLIDRMEIIEVNSYTLNEKMHIAKEHLFAKQLSHNGLTADNLEISEEALKLIITGYTREAGVRGLERKLGEIARKAAKKILENGGDRSLKLNVTEDNLTDYLGVVKYLPDEAKSESCVGVARGLAWTSAGGDTLSVEVGVMPGKGTFEITGNLGDVMKESAKTGISFIRSVSVGYGIAEDFFEKHDLHIHIPEGAVPKDGPSAGITMATAMLSAVTGSKVRGNVAMTGEITLRGRVLPVGGLKEKILAAKTAGIDTVLIPSKNRKDIEELDEEVTSGISVRYVSDMKEVLAEALEN
ncbi:MAG: endopeptidase La [Lachnospiraceae bacterium]|nr:endopeptidase La [Lachnospiraceae bacterium]